MANRTRQCSPATWGVLFGSVMLALATAGASPAWGQGAGVRHDPDGGRKAAKDWASTLLQSFPESLRKAGESDKGITFLPLDLRDVTLGRRQRRSAYDWMLRALNEAGKIGLFTVMDRREHAAVARALENTGDPDWFQAYQEALGEHRTRITLSCRGEAERGGFRLHCTAIDNTNLQPVGIGSVLFREEWMGAPLRLEPALRAVAGDVVRSLRGSVGAVSIVDQRVGRESPLARYVAQGLKNEIVKSLAARRSSHAYPVGGDRPRTAEHDIEGELVFLTDKVELRVMVRSNGQDVNAVREFLSTESVSRVEAGLDPGARLSTGQNFRDCEACPEMIVIPPGEYTMGSPAAEDSRGADEGPQRRVRIPPGLAVGRYEVTRTEYAAFMRESGHRTAGPCGVGDGSLDGWRQDAGRSWQAPGFDQGERHPVVCVNWDDAKAYAAWLSRKTGKGYRLLSEAEWEYVARAGTTASRYWGDDAIGQCRHANGADSGFGENYRAEARSACRDRGVHTAEVGTHGKNGFGLSDMLGNVWEWVEDCLHKDYVGGPGDGAPWVRKGDCSRRMLRGGSWYTHPGILRSAARGRDAPASRNFDTGFRVARDIVSRRPALTRFE